ncbi:MAG: GIY-YIG nuclease family protein [Candidatus Helarchaeota archaeon]
MTIGIYALIIQVERNIFLKIGKNKNYNFLSGFYIYVGSALGKYSNNIENRLKRHFSNNKKLFWHIDYFLAEPKVQPIKAVFAPTNQKKECELSAQLFRYSNIKIFRDFGNSDCHSGCKTHLYYFNGKVNLDEIVFSAFRNIGLTPKLWNSN